MAVSSSDVRTLTLVGHGDSAKTSLAEALLHKAGAIKRLGSIGDGTTTLDYDDDEKSAKHSIDSGVAHLDWKGKRLYIVDAPGYPDFVGSAIATFAAVDTAVICVNASKGISVNTRHMWDQASLTGKAKVIVVTRIDAENLNLPTLVHELKDVFGDSVLPVNLPVGRGPAVSGVVSVLEAGDAEDHDGVVGDEGKARQNLVDKVVEEDEDLMMRYLDGEVPTKDEMNAALLTAIKEGHIVPVLFCSPEKGVGVQEALDFLTTEIPSAKGRVRHPIRDAEGVEEIERDASGPFSAVVWKTAIDPFVGKLSYLRILSGELKDGQEALNPRTGETLKLAHAFRPVGKEQVNADSAVAGEIVVLPKIEALALGDTLCDPSEPCRYAPIDWPDSMVSLAIEAKSSKDEQKLGPALTKLQEEDPTFRVEVHRETHERVASGMSALHLDVMLERLKRRFHVEVDTRTPKIPYRETITGKSDGHHRHKKQSGGRGQFAEVYLRVWAQERGEGFEFVDSVVGGSVPRSFIPAVEKGIREEMQRGILAGYPVVDVVAELYDGKDHPVDSSEAAFKMAGARGFRDGFMKAKPVLLEPVMLMEIVVPSRFMGDITGDLNKRRGRVQGMDARGQLQVITAQVPLAEISRYSTELRSLTGGEGSYSMKLDHYDVVPHNVAETVIAKAGKRSDDD